MNTMLNLSASPHERDRWTTPFIMRMVALSLLPATVVGILVYGWNALGIVALAVISAVAAEWVFDKVCHKPSTIWDGSAVVTGLLLALSLGPQTPLYIPVIGSVFAIVVCKGCFGGLGKNFINPALAGRCFLLISFGRTMTEFQVDGVSMATPMAQLMNGEAVNVTQMFFGNANGVIGTSILAMLVGGLFLWSMDIIHGQICFSVLISFTLMMGLFGGQGFDPTFLMAHLCGGGVIMGAFFMATDYVTSPVSRLGQTVYGVLIGVLGAVFRIFGSSADSFSYSVIIANLFVPLIDTYIVSKPFAYRKSAIAARSGEPKKPLLQRVPRPVIALAIIALVAGLALSGVYTMTKDTIEAQQAAAKAASFREVLPEAESFEDVGTEALDALDGGVYGDTYGRVYINDAVRGLDADGNTVGYVYSVTSAEGYEGNITLSMGLDTSDTLKGIAYTELKETPGKGMLAAEPAFVNQFNNRKIIGTVGQLQFEVIQYRLENEYNAKCRWEPISLYKACWIESDDEKELEAFKKRKYQYMAKDREGRDVFLADSGYVLQMAQQDFKHIKFHFTSEF